MTTSYATINGQILYETTNGVRTEYMHDALGSVIGTTDASRNVQNTYRWAGYGTRIAKTGTAADPKFLWNGTSGYRVTGRAHAESYVRRRHYGTQQGAWGSIDPLWPVSESYGYCGLRPIGRIDPTGMLHADTVDPVVKKPCGGATQDYKWFLDAADIKTCANMDCYIVQHINLHWDAFCCGTLRIFPNSCPSPPAGVGTEYWEVWRVHWSNGGYQVQSLVGACAGGYVGCDDVYEVPAAGPTRTPCRFSE